MSGLGHFIKTLRDHFDGQAGNVSLRRELGWDETRYWAVHGQALKGGQISRSRGRGGSIKFASLDKELKAFIKKLKNNLDGYATNPALRQELKWEKEQYWAVHQLAFEKGLIEKGRGQGGTVRFLPQKQSAPDDKDSSFRERDLYKPAQKTIEENLFGQQEYSEALSQITAYLGSTPTGGTWSRPDISVVAMKEYRFPPRQEFVVTSFEIKTQQRISVAAVFEALSHKQWVHRSYVLYHIGESEFDNLPESARIMETAYEHGIGVFVAGDMSNYDTWVEKVVPDYDDPDPQELDIFIRNFFGEADQERIVGWFTDPGE